MAKKYKDDDGAYLAMCDDEDEEEYTFGWYFPDEGYVTCPIVEILHSPEFKSGENDTKTQWETWIVGKVAVEMGANERGGFGTRKEAKAAMIAANEALLRGDRKPLPRWVIEATNAGWTAPEGWKL
jgi:hypothetical protein